MSKVSGSMSISKKQGLVLRPGMVVISPHKGKMNPAPAETRTSLIGRVNPVGAPFFAGS